MQAHGKLTMESREPAKEQHYENGLLGKNTFCNTFTTTLGQLIC